MILSAIGTVLLVALGFWIFGGFALRFGGAVFILVGAVGLAVAGNANGSLLVMLGALLQWAGRLHFALRHGTR